jgi:hypothetical protein
MNNRTKTISRLCAVYLVSSLLIASLTFGQELPRPGTVIDASNYKTYAHLFPAEILPLFEGGYGLVKLGILKPISLKVGRDVAYHLPKTFLGFSAVNKGRYSLDAEGNIVGGWKRLGLPFPDLQINDKDFATKLMWNYAGRYTHDDLHQPDIFGYLQRKGEPVRWNHLEYYVLNLVNRVAVPPTPLMESYDNAANLQMLHYKEPESQKNMMTVSARYRDPLKSDEVFIYLPNLRRVLRGDTGQRAVPLQGNIASLDDIEQFDGRTAEFTYTLIGDRKMLVPGNSQEHRAVGRNPVSPIPFPAGPYSIADCWVVDIFSKSSVYPVSKKRIYIDKETLKGYYTFNWDRAGKLWKIFVPSYHEYPILGEPPVMQVLAAQWGVDLQFGMTAATTVFDPHSRFKVYNQGHLLREEFAPAGMLKRGQ